MIHNALVIGGGIGGLACATALARRGIAVTVLEQATEIQEVGAGIQISPNGLSVLRALGLEEAVLRTGAVEAQAVVLADYRDGREVARLDISRRPGQRYLFVHRADLIALLARAARQSGVAVQLGARVTEVVAASDPDTLPQVRLADNSQHQAELVVCADGLRSVGRGAFGKPAQSFFTGQVAWRAMIPVSGKVERVARITMGPGRHIVTYPLRDGALMNLVAVEERSEWAAEGWEHRDDPIHLRHAFLEFSGPVAAMLHDVESVRLWGLFRHPVAQVWARGGVALLGDAAHPTLPFLAQGANLALEDAWVLARCVAEDKLGSYQGAREARVTRIIATASGNARKYHLRNEMVRWAAHRALWLGCRLAPELVLRQYDWIYREDVTRG